MRYFVNPIFTILTLILLFFVTSVSWVLLNAEFLAFILILVYVGALIVLFLFIVMFFEQKNLLIINFKSIIISLGIMIILALIIEDYGLRVPIVINNNNIYLLGQELFTNYLLQVIISGLLLLGAIVSVINIYREK
jgi:NADH-quinone oxidoreductase subunit J